MLLPKFILLLVLLAFNIKAADVEITPRTTAVELKVQGQTGREYTIEGTSDFLTWTPAVRVALTNAEHSWLDNSMVPQRFFRVLSNGVPRARAFADNFRLIDHRGVSRELFHFETNKAVVLIFTGNGCTNVQNLLSGLRALRTEFGARGVQFWMIDANASDTRSNIIAEANALGIDFPILHDEVQLVARSYGAQNTPEAVAIDCAKWDVFYKGAIDDRASTNTNAVTQFFLRAALTEFLAGRQPAVRWTEVRGCEIDYHETPVVDYSTVVAPILQASCVRCHVPGGIGAFAMTNYASVVRWATSIKEQIMGGHMPPWHADPHFGKFTNDYSLTLQEKIALTSWIDQGTPRGTGPDILTNVPPTPPKWALGQPDIVLRVPSQTLQATGTIPYKYINITNTYSNMWLRAAVISPGNVRAMHHCLVYSGASSAFQGMDGFFAGYVPGQDQYDFPAGTAKYLRLNEVLQFQLHYTATGQPETDQTEMGLYLMPIPNTNQMPKELKTKSSYNFGFSIPPFHPDYEVSTAPATFSSLSFRFANAAWIYELSPHMHYRGSRFKYEAVYPDQTRETLLSVPHYEFDWQTLYRFAQPKFVPAGTTIVCTGAFDNSPQNLHNPDPSARVGFGEQSWQEMFIGYFNYVDN